MNTASETAVGTSAVWYPYDEEYEKERKRIDLDERIAKMKNDTDSILIKKVESLVDMLEASEPNLEKQHITGLEEGSNFRPILDDTDKRRIIKRIFSLIDKY